ncbi:MAG: hypothetical protein V2A57_01000 [Elusimicrobiota bacterium]
MVKLRSLYEFVIETGKKKDPRGNDIIQKALKTEQKKFDKLTDDEKSGFDKERLSNPYADSRILNGKEDTEVKSVLLGVDVETPELLLMDSLRKSGKKIDLAIAHHPEGRAYANFYEVMNMQADILHKFGVPINIAEAIMEPRIKEVSRKVMPQNHTRASDAARLLDIPFMNVHTPADNCVNDYLQKLFDKNPPETLDDVLKMLKKNTRV